MWNLLVFLTVASSNHDDWFLVPFSTKLFPPNVKDNLNSSESTEEHCRAISVGGAGKQDFGEEDMGMNTLDAADEPVTVGKERACK